MKTPLPSCRALRAGFTILLLALASGQLTHAQTNTGTGPNATVVTTNGTGAALSITTGTYNAAYGFDALRRDTTGKNNTAIGSKALMLNLTGNYNAALGFGALSANLADNNTAVGYQSLFSNTSGTNNVALGYTTLSETTTGGLNTAVGVQALRFNTVGASNLAGGYQALFKNTTGNLNVALGDGALYNSTTGSHNIGLGEDGGYHLTTGSNNIYIGNPGGAPGGGTVTESGKIRIGKTGTHTATFLAGVINGNGAGLTGLTSASLAPNSVTGTQIANAAVSSAKLASGLSLAGTTVGTFSGPLTGNATTATNATSAGGISETDRKLSMATAMTFGTGAGLTLDPDGDSGLLLETSAGGEGAGLFLNGDVAVIYSPGDNDILRVYDEDNLAGASPVPAFKVLDSNAGISTPGTGTFGGAITCASISFTGNAAVSFPGNGTFGGEITCVSIEITSDRNAKEGFKPVSAREVLDKVARLPITEWQYKTHPDARHIGPMAQDFHAAFATGRDERHITSVDADGVALAAIQGLNEKLEQEARDKDQRIQGLERDVRQLRNLVEKLAARQARTTK